jgi:hypothetical protein
LLAVISGESKVGSKVDGIEGFAIISVNELGPELWRL